MAKTVPRAYIDNFTEGLNKVSDNGRKAIAEALSRIDYTDMTKAIDEIVQVMEAQCGISAQAAAEMAAYFYRGMSMYETGRDATGIPTTGRKAIATEKAVRGIVQLGVNGNFTAMLTQLQDRLDYEVKKAAGETVMRSAGKDLRKPRFARVPSGVETCSFCILLASRGPVYATAADAGFMNHYHANCDCRIVPVWGSVAVVTEAGAIIRRGGGTNGIEGYNPDRYFNEYLKMRAAGKKWKSPNGWNASRTANPDTMSVRDRADYYSDMKRKSVDYLREATTYQEFMERAGDVEALWNNSKGTKDKRQWFKQVSDEAKKIRQEWLDQPDKK